MKAILVMNIPKSCLDCPVNTLIDWSDDSVCGVANTLTNVYYDERPKWCPLKQMPQRKVGDDLYERYGSWTLSDEKEVSYRVGYNACIDEILGETE